MGTDQVVDSPTVRILVVVAQAARGDELRRRLLSVSRGRGLELCLLAPAFAASGLEYVASDVDRGIQRALEKELFERVCRRFELPVWEIELNEDEGGITHAVQVAHSPVAH